MAEALAYCLVGGVIAGGILETLIAYCSKQAWRLDDDWKRDTLSSRHIKPRSWGDR